MKVSIITATYNSARTVRDTLESVKNQTYADIEHLIIDGLSKDDTLDIVREYPHVAKIFSEKDKGLYDAMNKGIARATGDVIAILNSDDFYADANVISDVVARLKDQRTDTLYADLQYVDEENTERVVRTWRSGAFVRHRFYQGWMPPHPTFFVKREVYERFGNFDLALKSSADYELMLRFLLRNEVSTTYLPRIIVKMRAGGQSNQSLSNRLKAHMEDRLAWEKNDLKPHLFTLPLKPLSKIKQYFLR